MTQQRQHITLGTQRGVHATRALVASLFQGDVHGNVAFRADAPSGVSVSFRNCNEWFTPVFFGPPPQRSCTTAFTVASTVVAGTYALTFVAFTNDGATQRADATMTVLPATTTLPPAVGFGLSLSPTSVTLACGDSVDVTIGVTRQPAFTGTIALNLENPTLGLAVEFRPGAVVASTASSVLARVKAVSVLPLSPVVLLICGRAVGWSDDCRPLTVRVNP